jgi:murein DD-endopeptidase MepM/ murein hydrolase activator NlpD
MENLTPVRPASIIGNTRLKELKTVHGVAKNLVLQKKKNFDLEKKFFKIQKDSIDRSAISERERNQELKKPNTVSGAVRGQIKEQSVKLYDLFKFFAGYKILQWMSQPENVKSLGEIAKAMKNIFKMIDFIAGVGVEGVLGGLHSILFGGSFLERFFGVFKAIGGFFIIRRLLSPGQILKDIVWILKNGKNIGKVFTNIGSGKFKEAIGGIFKLLNPNLYIAYSKGLTAGIKRVILKVFGKNALKFLTKVASKIGFASAKEFVKNTIKTAAKPLSKIPLIGPVIGFGLNLIFGDPVDKAAVKLIGSSIGAWLGGIVMGALGSIIPFAGTAAGATFGAVVGGLLGDWVGDKLYGFFKGFSAPKEPALAVGGIVTKPTRALIGEAGPEAVIPLPRIYDGTILNAPMGIVASSMIGGIDAVISSLGPIGLTIRPYASSLLSPYRREFGSSNYVFTSDIGGTIGGFDIDQKKQSSNSELEKILGTSKTLNIIAKKESSEESKKARYNSGNSIREILADILNNIINLDFKKKTSGRRRRDDKNPPTSGGMLPGDAPPEVKAMLEAIAGGEGSWDSVNPSTTVDGLSNMTIADARRAAMQKGYSLGGSGAMGKWQQMPEFILSRARDAGLDPNKDKFNQENQTKIARMLMASVYPGGESQLVKDAQVDPLSASAKLRGTWPSLPGGSQQNTTSQQFISRFNSNVSKYSKMQTGGLVSRGDITSKFGKKESFRKHAHEGIDIAFGSGTPLSFTLGGQFMKIGRTSSVEKEANGGYGQYMDVKLTDGKIARLAHLSSIPSWVKEGQNFNPNSVIAMSGGVPKTPGAGRSGGAHLHLEQHTTKKDLAETLNGKVDPLTQGLFSLLRKGGTPGQATAPAAQTPTVEADRVAPAEESTQDQQPVFDPIKVSESLGKLYQMLNAPIKFNGAQMEKDSMKYLQAAKDVTAYSDTYIMMSGTNTITNTNLITPVEFPDYSAGSYSSIDSSLAFNLKTRL